MAQLVSVKLSRFDSQPWGFRLQGGKDFAQPLVIQKVNGSSLAEKAGLQAGDALIRVNAEDLFNLSHKDAQNALVRAGNSFELTVQRGGSTWRPSVTPVGPAPSAATPSAQPVTKTSLAYNQPPAPTIGSGHNTAAKPFGAATAAPQYNGDQAKNLASKLYNSPVGLYSEETIAETLSAQTEVLAGGVLGVNFKKNEKTYNAANSEVLKMVQEIDNEPREPEPAICPAPVSAPTTPRAAPVSNPLAGLRHVTAPETKPDAGDANKALPPGQNICAACERLIVGLFVRIKDKNLHVECFKCATCGTSLKNVGYYNINNKLYCDVHAKLVARQNPPAPNLEPVTVPPGVKPPSSIIGSALSFAPQTPLLPFSTLGSGSAAPQPASPGSPLPGTLGPLPFHAAQSGIRHVNAPRSVSFQPQTPPSVAAPAPTIQAPKLNFGQPAPAVCPPGPAPARPLSDSQADGTIQYQSYATVSQSAYSAASQNVSFGASCQTNESLNETFQSSNSSFESCQSHKKMSICSQEVGGLHLDAQNVVKQLSEILEDQERCTSPTPIDEVVDRVSQSRTQTSSTSREEQIQRIEQQEQWKNYQSCANKHISTQETALAFLRSHSTPVTELEALYEQQQKEIEEHHSIIQRLGHQKRMSIDETQIRELENLIIENEGEIAEKQKKQAEIEKKKRVHFQIEEEKDLEVVNNDDNSKRLAEEQSKERERIRVEEERKEKARQQEMQQQILQQQQQQQQQILQQQQQKLMQQQELQRIQSENADHHNLLSVHSLREHARTPVAELEAYDRHDEMSRKTETIFHTYEHLVQEEEDSELSDSKNNEKRPVTPRRAASPMTGSIPGAEVNLLLKNIQGIDFEFQLSDATNKKQPKTFKLPDLRNLSATKPYAPAKSVAQVVEPIPLAPSVPIFEVLQPTPSSQPPPQTVSAQVPSPIPVQTPSQPQPRKSQDLIAPEKSQEQQIKEKRKQVHEELALNERFRKKQERLGVEQRHFERAKTPVAEFEEEFRHHEASERTHHVYESYDKVIETAERPRSRIGQPIPENQSITDAEKSLFFQNISGINYEFNNISELTAMKHLPSEQKSLFIRDVEQRTKSPVTIGINDFTPKSAPAWAPKPDPYQSQFVQALTTMPDPAATASRKSYEEFRHEQEILYKQQKLQQQSYCEQQRQKDGIGTSLPKNSSLLEALTIAPERAYSPLPTLPVVAPVVQSSVSQPVSQPPLQAPAPSDLALQARKEPEPLPEKPMQVLQEEPKYDGSRRRSSGFPGVNVQRTPYQMLRGSQIQSSFIEDLVTQQSSISQFLSETTESETKVHRKDTIDAAFGLIPSSSQVVYAPPPPADKRAELVATQSQFGSSLNLKSEKLQNNEKPLPKPISLTEALTIAPEDSYIPFAEPAKPVATLVYGGAAVALTKAVEEVEKTSAVSCPAPVPIEIKPCYQVKDLQLSKNMVKGDYSGFVEEAKTTSAQSGTIKGQNITGSYQKQEESTSSTVMLEKTTLPPLKNSEGEVSNFPPVSNQLKAEFSQISQSSSSQKSNEQSEQVEVVGDVVKTTKRRVVEVAESSHKEVTQVRVVGSGSVSMGRDPISGLRRTSNEVVAKSSGSSSYQATSSSGLQKASSIPTYQNQLGEKITEAAPPAKIDSKEFKPRPRSVVAEKVTSSEVKVPMAFRSRTPVPLPKIDFTPKQQQLAQPVQTTQKNMPTYNQDQVYRSASPRPIPVPKAQFGAYAPQQLVSQPVVRTSSSAYRTTSPALVPSKSSYKPTQPQSSFLKPAQPTVYRSTSPVPVPKMVKTNESYQQPISSWRVQPVKPEKRVSWPPKEEPVSIPTELPITVAQSSVRAKISQQEEKVINNVQEMRRSSLPSMKKQIIENTQVTEQKEQVKSVRDMISQQEQQAKINLEEARRSSLIKSIDRRQSEEELKIPRTSLAGKQAPGPKHDPITAPRPFGTPTPQRRIATPHFQPITPVAITQGQSPPITAPKLSFSSQTSNASNIEASKVSLANSSGSAFKPIDTVVPVKPVAFRPAPAPTLPGPPASCDYGAGAGAAGAGGAKGATFGGLSAPRRGRGVLTQPNAGRIALCAQCNGQIRGPFITALGKIWCPEHFVCNTPQCRRPLADIGFVEEQGGLFCEFCFEKYIAPNCDKCSSKIKGDCLNAIGKHFHPECFTCAYCGKLFGNSPFYLEDGLPYCENDWNELFTTKCFACGFPIEAGDRWVEALNNNYHSQCFNCAVCKKNLEGQSFFAKGGRPFCKAHAR